MNLSDIIIKLCSVMSPSGSEEAAAQAVRELMQPLCDELWSDNMGNLFALRRSGRPNAKKLMLTAHMDEIGLIVTSYEGGFLRFSSIGGVDPRMLPGREVRVLAKEPVFGVIDTMPPHVLAKSDMDKTIDKDSLFIDVGLNEESVKAKIPLGTSVVFATGCERLGEHMLCGKSLDDRSGVAMIIKAFEFVRERDIDVDLYAMFTTQEEVGLRGAKTGAFSVDPDVCVAIDVTHALTPDAKPYQCMKMGSGAAIGVGPNMHRALTDALIALAEEKEIPYQIEVLSGNSGTDAWVIQTSRAGVATLLVSLPIKYMHSPVETADIRDAEAVTRLLGEFVLKGGELL